MKSIAFRNLRPYQERQFFAATIAWDDPSAVAALYDSILQLKVTVDSDAVTWIAMWRELEAIVDQEYSIRYVEMTCDTEDSAKEKAYQHFSEKLAPIFSEKSQALKTQMLANPLLVARVRAEAPEFFRRVETDAAIFRQENIPLGVEVEHLSQEYQKISAAMTTEWNGQQVTLTQLARESENPDRAIRERAHRAEWDRRAQDKATLDKVFDQMFELRTRIAKNAGFANFRDYSFRARHRYDYTADDCFRFHEAIQRHLVPLTQELHRARRRKLGVSELRPWDLSVDIAGEKPHAPFRDVSELSEKVDRVFSEFDPELSGFYRQMVQHNLFDLANRKGKAPGGYQTSFGEARLPFIFMNAVGVHRDVITLLHESGHAFHSFLAREQDIFQCAAPMEFCEVASMSMELMASRYLPKVFGQEVSDQLMRQTLLAIPQLLLRIAMVDSLQHWMYTDPRGRDQEARHEKWYELSRAYMPEVVIDDTKAYVGIGWHKVLHIFQMPFYYIEYGVAELGALQFWQKYQENPATALTDYKTALAAGGTLGLKDLFRRANLRWPMDEKVVAPLAEMLDEKLSVYL